MKKLAQVEFCNIVSFGGSLKSATSGGVIGDRPGQTPMEIELSDDLCFVTLRKKVNNIMRSKVVPMTNVSSFEYPEEKKTEQVKK